MHKNGIVWRIMYTKHHCVESNMVSGKSLRKAAFASLLLLAFWVIGCGRQQTTTSGPTNASPGAPSGQQPFRVALIMSGSTTDHGWNQGAYEALKAVAKKLGLSDSQIAFKEQATSADSQLESLRAFASRGYNVVIGHGEEYEQPALRIAPEFPKTLFVISSGSQVAPNVTPIVFKLEDGAYLEGMLAAGMSKSGIIGAVGADPIGPVKSVFSAYALGAKAISPQINVLQPLYTNDWDDVGKAKQATLSLIGRGADVIIQDLDNAAQGVFNAVEQSNRPGHPVYALGTNSDQNGNAPDVILASAPIDLYPAFLNIIQAAKEGTFKPNATPYGLKSGVIGFVYNPKLEPKIPEALKQKIDAAKQKIIDGTLVIPKAD
jgi:basic membrane protein A